MQIPGFSPVALLGRTTSAFLRASVALTCAFLWISAPTLVDGQPAAIQQSGGEAFSVRIVGRLVDLEDVPIPGATIGLATWEATTWQPMSRSGADGTYDIRVRLQRGAYRLIATFGLYQIESQYFEVRSPVNSNITVNLRATRAKSDNLPPQIPSVGLLSQGSFPPPAPPAPPPPPAYVPQRPGNQEFVNVYYVTNRSPTVGKPAHYSDVLALKPIASYGICEVSIPPTHKQGQMERPAIWRFEPVEDVRQHIVITGRQLVPGEKLFQQRLHTAFQQSGSEAFLFIHGYNVEFDDAVRRTAQLFRDLQFDGVPILFSWPGQNAWWRYPAAESAVDNSARLLEDFLKNMLVNERLTAVNVVAHSMGNRILTTALERLALQRINPGVANIVMAAPDVNVADFGAVSKVLKDSAKRTTIYSSSADVALLLSKAFHSYPRLGEAPPLQLSPQIDTIDASAIKRDLLGHSYFGDSVSVLRDIFLLIKQGLEPPKRFLQQKTVGSLPYWLVPSDPR